MATQLPSFALKRTSFPSKSSRTNTSTHQIRHASLLKRPIRPYTFTQLITLTDGSTYTARTTSPAPVYKSTKDSRNHAMWQPSLHSLRNIEQDEAGKLRAFRERFGRGWDLEAVEESGEKGSGKGKGKVQEKEKESGKKGRVEEEDSLMDLISNAGHQQKGR